jgi:arylformamidase
MTVFKNKQIYDVTINLSSDFPTWPGDTPARIEKTSTLSKGDIYNSSSIHSSLHWGTHIDAPYHLYQNKWTIDQIPLNILMGEVQVLEIPKVEQINVQELEKHPIKSGIRIIIKTRNSEFWNNPDSLRTDFSALTPDAARYLVQRGTLLVGIDYASLDLYEASDLPVHQILCSHNIIGVEYLDLRAITAGFYELICLPMKIKNGDGAPARVLLMGQGKPTD